MKKSCTLPLLMLLALTFTSGRAETAQQNAPVLADLYGPSFLRQNLIAIGDWKPFARYEDRDFWRSLPEAARKVQVARAEESLGKPWPELPASLYLQFSINGNRSNYEEPYFARRDRLADLVIAEMIEAEGRFIDEIVNGLWLIMEESSWVIPAHVGSQKAGSGLPYVNEPIVDLFSAETAALVAWTAYLLGDRLDQASPLIRQRFLAETSRRVLEPCLARDDFWWMAFQGDHINNWNPWCNSNWLTADLLLERDGNKRLEAVAKIMRSLDKFITSYHPDGGCDEGPGYWGRAGASLFDCLELLYSATGGKIDVYSYPLIQNMGRYIYRAHIDGPYFINFADAPAKTGIAGDLVYRFGKRIADDKMTSLGAWAESASLKKSPAPGGSLGRRLPALADVGELTTAIGTPPYVRDAWLDGIQVMAARSREGSAEGFYLAAKGGHNAESHNHNDVGNFIVYYDGLPVIVDAGVGVYTRQTFSD
ncbi:MAG TPA: heparinase II/III family protein, partial [Candidatus Glassbacteria bacterium]|nr:heparinase II/III family protein [Candidatus Glassbacteria bacterium]